jgi:hypothetical protein
MSSLRDAGRAAGLLSQVVARTAVGVWHSWLLKEVDDDEESTP